MNADARQSLFGIASAAVSVDLYSMWRRYEKTGPLRTTWESMKGPTLSILRAKPKDFFGSEVSTKAATLVANITVLQACFRELEHNETRVHLLERAKQTLAARELKPDAKVALFLSEHINTLTAQNDSGAVGRSKSPAPPAVLSAAVSASSRRGSTDGAVPTPSSASASAPSGAGASGGLGKRGGIAAREW